MKKQLSKQSTNSPFCGFRGLLALLLFPLWGLGGWGLSLSAQTINITPVGANYGYKTVTFRVSWSDSFSPVDRVWVWIDFCPVTGITPSVSFSPASITMVNATNGGSVDASSLNGRGFFVTTNPTVVTAQLSNAYLAFNWCAYGSGAPPRAELQPDGSYLLKGTPPFKVNGDWKDESMTSYDADCIESFTDFTENPAGSVTAKPSVASVSSPAICNNTTANLTATVSGGTTTAMTYTWNIGGTSSTTNVPTKTTSALTATTTYTVQARNDAGCTSTVSNTGTITVRPKFTAGAITTASGSASWGSNPNITIASSTHASGGNGAITYQWRRTGSSAATLTGAAQTYTISTNPTNYSATGTYRINRYAHDQTCNTGWVASTGTYTLTVNRAYPFGAGTKTWTCGTQTWTGASKATPSACTLVSSLSTADNPPNQYFDAKNGYGYYYNYSCQNVAHAQICMSNNYYYPSLAELEVLYACDGGVTASKMGLAGRVGEANTQHVGVVFELFARDQCATKYYGCCQSRMISNNEWVCGYWKHGRNVHCVRR